MSLTLEDGINLQKAVLNLQNYKFSSSATKKIAINFRSLQENLPDEDAKRSEILIANGNPATTDPSYKKVVEDFNAWVKTYDLEVDFDKLKFDEFNIGQGDSQNHIPPVVLAFLYPMIDFS